MNFWTLLTDICILLGGALFLGGIFIRLRQSPIVGYLLAGVILGGPGSFYLINNQVEIEAIAELGVSLLLFSLGLEFSWNRIKAFNKSSVVGGILQVVITPLCILVLCSVFGIAWKTSLAIGLIFTLSSTACVLRILQEKGEMDSFPGRNALAVLLIQDIAVVPFAIIIPILASDSDLLPAARGVGILLVQIALLILGLYLLLNKVMVRFLGAFSTEQNRDLGILLAVVTGVGSSWISHEIGISPAMGAFVAGMLLGNSSFSTQIRSDVSSIKTVFLTLFFSAAGMVANPIWIFQNLGLVLGLSLGIILGKSLFIGFIFRLLKQPAQYALISGFFLGQIGEFAFVLSHLGNEFGLLSPDAYLLIASTTIVTLFLTPYTINFMPRLIYYLFDRFNGAQKQIAFMPETPEEQLLNSKTFVIGFGPSGVTVANKLKELGRPPTVIDLNPNAEKIAQDLGLPFILGDAQNYEVMQHAGFQQASMIIITVPSKTAAEKIIHLAKRIAPTAKILVRSHYSAHKRELESLGPYVVVVDEEAVANALAQASQQCL